MVELLKYSSATNTFSSDQLLDPREIVLVVDDSPEIVVLLNHFLQKLDLPTKSAINAFECDLMLRQNSVALVLLDIGLPDRSGIEILQEISHEFPDLGIIIVIGTTDIEVALRCLRSGADDYLTKPVNLDRFTRTVFSVLTKRKLSLDNKRFQKELEANAYKNHFLHQLSMKMNSAYLSTSELSGILHAILVGITANEGLRFNRAFLALFDENQNVLTGRLAIGPATPEEAGNVWESIHNKGLGLQELIDSYPDSSNSRDISVNRLIQQISIPSTARDHVLMKVIASRKSKLVNSDENIEETNFSGLEELLKNNTLAIIPLYSPRKSIGVLIADNFITKYPITEEDVQSLEIFANQASLAIEHCHLYDEMSRKISELKSVTEELERSKDFMVSSEKFSAVGYISAQLVHSIRNPITTIGGVARLLHKKITDEKLFKFLDILSTETEKIEGIIQDIFTYVEHDSLQLNRQPLYPVLNTTIKLFYTTMQANGIVYHSDLQNPDPSPVFDSTKIRQVLYHLIKNAIESMAGGGILTLKCIHDERKITISISDTGFGISDSNLGRVTDPFFTTKTYGTGMGLTLVRSIVEKHQGTLQLQHAEPSGLSAIITLPFDRE